ncbi:MAG: Twitching motility protein PilT [Oscillospiraceae bacterium]|nr:Twitching motility protein PilT [Oscillospiraceae bacterium]
MNIEEILVRAVQQNASDILIVAGLPVSFKLGQVIEREGAPLSPEKTAALARDMYVLAGNRQMDTLLLHGDDDFSVGIKNMARFRINAFKQRGSLSMVIRIVSFQIPDPATLGIPESVISFADLTHGLVLITGPAGSGKSTTLACMVDHINTTRNAHVICIEDPIEYLHHHKMSVVSQRELNLDTDSYDAALRAALRQAPDVILLGELRDAETMRAAVTAAETGHLVLSTLHTIGASSTVDRMIDAFPSQQQNQIRNQLAQVLEGIVTQQLFQDVTSKGLVPAFEIMKLNTAVRNMIRESKSHQLDNVIATSSEQGMITMDQSILKLANAGRITPTAALRHCINPDWMERRMSGALRT